ncbi:MAG: hypothetical protein L3K16_03630 [Thermoplasmata archaeon]|nr:hypothetical protein [Thermoplasmata archaeon]
MPGKRSKATRKLRGAQKWIVQELSSLKPGVRMSTSDLAKRISKGREKKFHKNSVYNALRLLVQRGRVRVVREGREKTYQIAGGAVADAPGPVASRGAPASATAARADLAAASSLPHKLALGEILVLRIEGEEVVTATNLHGQLVFERHRLPG